MLSKYIFYGIGIIGYLIECIIGFEVIKLLSGLMGGD